MSAAAKIVLLGVGQTARALVAYLFRHFESKQLAIWGTTRAHSGDALGELGIAPILLGQGDWRQQLIEACHDANVLVSFPPGPFQSASFKSDSIKSDLIDAREQPEQDSDQVFSELISAARPKTVVYISTTGVYGKTRGVIDESSAVDREDPRALVRLNAEKIWQEQAIVLRAPGLYSSNSGLHKRLLSGNYSLPGDGTNYVSRIHLDDLAAIISKIFFQEKPVISPQIYVVGDLKPSTHLEVVSWLCQQLSLPMPPSKPLSEVNPTLRGSRQISSAKILADLDLKLKYPSYVEGMSECLGDA
ncbi:hypothetical protein BH11CYA1_BH11CYA1_49110 [soil metagenome]